MLNATLQHHFNKYVTLHPKMVNKLTASLYVDNVVTGAKDEEEAYQLYLESKSVFREGGFNLRKFVTNSDSLQLKIDEKERSIHSPHDDQLILQMKPIPRLHWPQPNQCSLANIRFSASAGMWTMTSCILDLPI